MDVNFSIDDSRALEDIVEGTACAEALRLLVLLALLSDLSEGTDVGCTIVTLDDTILSEQ